VAEEQEFSERVALDSGEDFFPTCFVEIPWAPKAEDGSGTEREIDQAEPLGSLVAAWGMSVWVWTCRPFTVARRSFSHPLQSAGLGSGPRKKVLLRLGPVGQSSLLAGATDYCDFSFPGIP